MGFRNSVCKTQRSYENVNTEDVFDGVTAQAEPQPLQQNRTNQQPFLKYA